MTVKSHLTNKWKWTLKMFNHRFYLFLTSFFEIIFVFNNRAKQQDCIHELILIHTSILKNMVEWSQKICAIDRHVINWTLTAISLKIATHVNADEMTDSIPKLKQRVFKLVFSITNLISETIVPFPTHQFTNCRLLFFDYYSFFQSYCWIWCNWKWNSIQYHYAD